jgi:hypothetical protein
MGTAKSLALIAVGYVLAVVGGLIAVAVNELLMPADIAQTSSGMVAFGDMILLVLVTGFLGLVPTLFLLKLCIDKAPRALLATELLIAALGPLSWLAVAYMAGGGPPPDPPQPVSQLLGLFVAFGAIPRIVAGPVLLVIEGLTFILIRGRLTRALLAAATLMDLVPMTLYALHMAAAIR